MAPHMLPQLRIPPQPYFLRWDSSTELDGGAEIKEIGECDVRVL